MKQQQWLPFWHFFKSIENELSYERWINKYLLFLAALGHGVIEYDDEWLALKKFCRAVFLQHHQDSDRFDELFEFAVKEEKRRMIQYITEATSGQETQAPSRQQKSKPSSPKKETDEKNTKTPSDDPVDPGENEQQLLEEPIDTAGLRTFYYQPPRLQNNTTNTTISRTESNISFLMTDEYFPVTRRQMVKGWQFLRYQETGGFTNEIDIPATVIKIARDGLFTVPLYKHGLQNREDTVIIFADCLGSMSPFHELTERLIETARTEGGHPRAPVFYFQNYPTGYVYRQANFSEPLKVKEALVKANRNSTIAIIISDGGAARGNTDSERSEERSRMTGIFLEAIEESCAHTIWLNPMPEHRWKGTAAELIAAKVYQMKPIIDSDNYNFQDTLRTILRHTKEF